MTTRSLIVKLFCLAALQFCLLPASFGRNASDSLRMDIAVFGGAKAEKVSILIQVTNLSNKTKNVSRPGRVDYVNGKIKAIGNYIVELEKLEDSSFRPFPPTADIDPVSDTRHWEIKPGKGLLNTIDLDGRSWGRQGFPKGRYRVRIAFNWDERSSSREHLTKWASFTIE